MQKILKIAVKSILVITLLYFISLSYSLFHTPHFQKEDNRYYNKDVYQQAQFLKTTLQEKSYNEKRNNVRPRFGSRGGIFRR